jgi:hypothetical protein
MVRKIALTAVLTAAFAASAFAATAPAGKWYVTKSSAGACTAAQSATAPTTGLVGSAKGYSNQTAANNEITKLKKAKPPVCS